MKTIFKSKLASLITFAMLLLACSSMAVADTQSSISIEDALIRILPGNLPSAGYLAIKNNGDTPRYLVGAESTNFQHIFVHQSKIENGMTSMQEVEEVPIDSGGTAIFEPGSYHLMLMNKVKDVLIGQEIGVKLVFKDGSKIPAKFKAVSPSHR